MSLSAEVRIWGCLDVLSNNLVLAYLANSPASTLCPLLLSPFNTISHLHEGVIRVSQAVRQSDATCMCVYTCVRGRETQESRLCWQNLYGVRNGLGKGCCQEGAGCHGTAGSVQSVPMCCSSRLCCAVTVCDSVQRLPWWHFAVCLSRSSTRAPMLINSKTKGVGSRGQKPIDCAVNQKAKGKSPVPRKITGLSLTCCRQKSLPPPLGKHNIFCVQG